MKELSEKYVKNEYYKDQNKPDKSVDVEIAIKLKEENKAFKVEKYKHSYPNCWRTDKPILYYPIDSWFIKASSISKKMVDLNKKLIGSLNQLEREDLKSGLKTLMIGIYQDQGFGEFHCQFGEQRMEVRKYVLINGRINPCHSKLCRSWIHGK